MADICDTCGREGFSGGCPACDPESYFGSATGEEAEEEVAESDESEVATTESDESHEVGKGEGKGEVQHGYITGSAVDDSKCKSIKGSKGEGKGKGEGKSINRRWRRGALEGYRTGECEGTVTVTEE